MHKMPQSQLALRVREFRGRIRCSDASIAPVCAGPLHHGSFVFCSCRSGSDGPSVPQFGLGYYRCWAVAEQPICSYARTVHPCRAYDDESSLWYPVDR